MLVRAGLACSALACTPLAQLQVWTVDDDAPADFAAIQPAVDAAASGDLVLVRTGTYLPFVVTGKSLVVAGAAEGAVDVVGSGADDVTRVHDVGAGHRVVLADLTLQSEPPPGIQDGPMLRVEGCAGEVWVQGVDSFGEVFWGHAGVEAALVVEDCDLVVVTDSGFTGVQGQPPSGFDPPGSSEQPMGGAVVRSSTPHAFESVFTANGTVVGLLTGAPGLRLVDSTATLQNAFVFGGSGGPPPSPLSSDGGTGGPGIQAQRFSTVDAPTLLVEDSDIDFTWSGAEGDLPLLLVDFDTTPSTLDAILSQLLVATDAILPPGFDVFPIYAQGALITADGPRSAGPVALQWIGEEF